ncbi:hypothetical protein [Legionella gresilensis]|uniref:hypothetical protein n=1 Tax=Legionella gresilensis TaxID=91823 RepID=UPI001040E199|nr:hypothetical protein [Legionella gresilensis]
MPKKLNLLPVNENEDAAADLEIIIKINRLIKEYNENSNNLINTSILKEIIEFAEKYITSIPIEQRSAISDTEDPRYLLLLSKFPYITQIIQLEKNVLELLELSRYGQTIPKAQWKLLSTFFISDQAKFIRLPVKRLEDAYYLEFKYAGETEKSAWINEQEPFYNNSLLSLKEVLKIMSKIIYLDDIIQYKLHFKNGLVYNNNALLFSTERSFGMNIQAGYCIFVLAPDLQLYASDPKETLDVNFHHSSFLRGRPVLCAGAIKVEQGKIVEINLLSGHYKPNRNQLLKFLKLLEEQGIDLSTISVRDHPDGSIQNAEYYLKHKGFLPGERFYKAAMEAKRVFHQSRYQECLDGAINLGHIEAKFAKADGLIKGVLYSKDFSKGVFLLLEFLSDKNITDRAKVILNDLDPLIISIYTNYNDIHTNHEKVSQIQPIISKVKKFDTLLFLTDFFKNEGNQDLFVNVQKHVLQLIDKKLEKNKKISLQDNAIIEKILKDSPQLATYTTYKERSPEQFEKEQPKATGGRLQPRKSRF